MGSFFASYNPQFFSRMNTDLDLNAFDFWEYGFDHHWYASTLHELSNPLACLHESRASVNDLTQVQWQVKEHCFHGLFRL